MNPDKAIREKGDFTRIAETATFLRVTVAL